MKTKHLTLITYLALIGIISLTSCSKEEGCTDPVAINFNPEAEEDDESCIFIDDESDHTHVTLNFTHNWDGDPVSNSTFNQFNYVNANNDTLSITRLRYLISDVRFYTSDGDSVLAEGFQLVDVTAGTNLTYELPIEVPRGSYTGVAFTFGFDTADNISNFYTDLNLATWNVPAMLGGGYHSMQMEGIYKVQGNDSLYIYHNIPTRFNMGVAEQNHFIASLSSVNLTELNAEIEVKMNIAEWYKNPNTWVLNDFHIMLMPNFIAQRMMQENGASVFSLGAVTQTN